MVSAAPAESTDDCCPPRHLPSETQSVTGLTAFTVSALRWGLWPRVAATDGRSDTLRGTERQQSCHWEPAVSQVAEQSTDQVDTSPGAVELTDVIRSAIIRGEFVPGQRLVETDLCEEFTASRAAVRAALRELVVEGLVDILRNKGARVRSVSVRDAVEIIEVRCVLEGLAAAKAAERVTPEQADGLRELGRQMREAVLRSDYDEYSSINVRLHATVGEIADHRTSAAIINRLGAQVVRYQFRLSRRAGRPAVSLPQHELIIAAIIAGDPQTARLAMEQHLHSVVRAIQDGEAG